MLNMQTDKSSRLILHPATWLICFLPCFFFLSISLIFSSLPLFLFGAFTWQLIKLREEVSASLPLVSLDLSFIFMLCQNKKATNLILKSLLIELKMRLISMCRIEELNQGYFIPNLKRFIQLSELSTNMETCNETCCYFKKEISFYSLYITVS